MEGWVGNCEMGFDLYVASLKDSKESNNSLVDTKQKRKSSFAA